MTRIVSGTWRGRRLVVPKGRNLRPTTERVREAWLSILAPELPGARVLDLFAGTGALGLEALSRGAEHCTFVERNAESLKALRDNIAALDAAGDTRVVVADAQRFAAEAEPGEYDIVLADPPFEADDAARLVVTWRERPFAKLLAVEHSPRNRISGDDTRRWGDVAVTFLRAP